MCLLTPAIVGPVMFMKRRWEMGEVEAGRSVRPNEWISPRYRTRDRRRLAGCPLGCGEHTGNTDHNGEARRPFEPRVTPLVCAH